MYSITAKLLASFLSLTSLFGFGSAAPSAQVKTTSPVAVTAAPVAQTPTVTSNCPAAKAQSPVIRWIQITPKTQTPATPAPKTPTPATPAPTTPAPTADAGMTAEEAQMLQLVNAERTKAGLPALQADPQLAKTARAKSQDMITYNYFDHQSPDLGSPFDQMRAAGIRYTTAGENIAGNHSVEAAHQALMNSPGHRANILNPAFKKIGIGIVHGGPYGMMFTQQFIG